MIAAVGYLASVLLGISLLVNNDLKFRWVNTFGCFVFIVYGVLIGANPIVVTNAALFCINVFYLVKIYRTEEAFTIAAFEQGDQIISRFLEFYRNDIRAYFPSYKTDDGQPTTDHGQQTIHLGAKLCFVVLRDMVIANIFEAQLMTDGTAIVHINYTVSKYRDYKVGKFIFDKEKNYLTGKGVRRIVYEQVENKNHEGFLREMGFGYEDDGKKTMVKEL